MAETLKVVCDKAIDAATGQAALAAVGADIKVLLVEQLEKSFAGRETPNHEEWRPLSRLDGRPPESRSEGRMKRGAIASVMQGKVGPTGFETDPAPLKQEDTFHWRFQDRGARRKAKKTSRVLVPGTPFEAPPARPFYSVGEDTMEAIAGKVADKLSEAMVT